MWIPYWSPAYAQTPYDTAASPLRKEPRSKKGFEVLRNSTDFAALCRKTSSASSAFRGFRLPSSWMPSKQLPETSPTQFLHHQVMARVTGFSSVLDACTWKESDVFNGIFPTPARHILSTRLAAAHATKVAFNSTAESPNSPEIPQAHLSHSSVIQFNPTVDPTKKQRIFWHQAGCAFAPTFRAPAVRNCSLLVSS